MTSTSYVAGWNDGYAEGYACKLADATEPFAPASADLPSKIEAAADLIQSRYRVYFGSDRPAAIGLARSIVAILAPPTAGDATNGK